MHQGQATSGVERFLRRENRVSVSFGGGGGIAREKVCGCPLIHVEQGRRTCIASPSLYPTSPLNILTRRVRGCRPIGLALPPRAPRVDTRENQELLKPRQKCQQRLFFGDDEKTRSIIAKTTTTTTFEEEVFRIVIALSCRQ